MLIIRLIDTLKVKKTSEQYSRFLLIKDYRRGIKDDKKRPLGIVIGNMLDGTGNAGSTF